jgi:hypothetical protein
VRSGLWALIACSLRLLDGGQPPQGSVRRFGSRKGIGEALVGPECVGSLSVGQARIKPDTRPESPRPGFRAHARAECISEAF